MSTVKATDSQEIRYRISVDGTILEIDGAWEDFAADNDAEDLAASPPVGTPFLDHVAGAAVRSLLTSILERVRAEEEPLELPFRCDAPDCRRHMRMRVEPVEDGSVLIRSWIVREEPRESVRLLKADEPRDDRLLRVCAWCKRASIDDEWVALEAAVPRLDLFGSAPVPGITHDICPGCAGDVLGEDVAATRMA